MLFLGGCGLSDTEVHTGTTEPTERRLATTIKYGLPFLDKLGKHIMKMFRNRSNSYRKFKR